MKSHKNNRKSLSNQLHSTASGSRKNPPTRRDSPTSMKEECRGGDDERLRRLEEKLENVLRRLDPRQEPENIVAETADRLAKMEEIINTMSKIQNEPQNGREAEARPTEFLGEIGCFVH